MTKQRLIYPVLFAALLSGCSLIPDYNRPNMDVPPGWTESDASNPTVVARDWWKNFNSEELNNLMEEALANNNDIGAAIHRVEQARGTLRSSRATLFPSVDADASISRDRINAGGNSLTNRDSNETGYNAGLSVGYELDLFGANRAAIDSDEAELLSTRFSKDATALIVMGDVAKGYFNLLNLEERLKISDQNLDSSRELLRIVQARFDAGATTQLDVSQQKSALASDEASRALIEQQMKIAKSALAVLLGKPPQMLQVNGKDLRNLPVPEIAPSQPSALLERRPDIRQAEAALLAANADIGAARAAFFPTINIGLDAGIGATPIGDPATTTLSLLSGLTAPIFKGGLLEGNLDRTKAREAELVDTYRKTVLVSFKDVEDSIASETAAQKREKSFETAMNEGRKAYELSKQQYDVGSIDFQTLLDARRTMLQAEDNYIQTKDDRLSAAVDLYKALGGGWSEETTTDSAPREEGAKPSSAPENAPVIPAPEPKEPVAQAPASETTKQN